MPGGAVCPRTLPPPWVRNPHTGLLHMFLAEGTKDNSHWSKVGVAESGRGQPFPRAEPAGPLRETPFPQGLPRAGSPWTRRHLGIPCLRFCCPAWAAKKSSLEMGHSQKSLWAGAGGDVAGLVCQSPFVASGSPSTRSLLELEGSVEHEMLVLWSPPLGLRGELESWVSWMLPLPAAESSASLGHLLSAPSSRRALAPQS